MSFVVYNPLQFLPTQVPAYVQTCGLPYGYGGCNNNWNLNSGIVQYSDRYGVASSVLVGSRWSSREYQIPIVYPSYAVSPYYPQYHYL